MSVFVKTDAEKGIVNTVVRSKSLYRSLAGSHFYGTEYEIWAEFGPVGNTEKKRSGPIMSNF